MLYFRFLTCPINENLISSYDVGSSRKLSRKLTHLGQPQYLVPGPETPLAVHAGPLWLSGQHLTVSTLRIISNPAGGSHEPQLPCKPLLVPAQLVEYESAASLQAKD